MPEQIAVYEPESAGLITTLGRLRYSLRVALTGQDLFSIAREERVGFAIIGATSDPIVADELFDRLSAAFPALTIVRARLGERTGLRRDGAIFLGWPLDPDSVIRDVIASLNVHPMEAHEVPRVKRLATAKAARAHVAVDWDSLDDITLSAPARGSASATLLEPITASDESSDQAPAEDPWDIISTVVEHPEGSAPSTARERPMPEPQSWAASFDDVTRAVWTMRELSETSSLRAMTAEDRLGLSHHARTLGRLLDQIGQLLEDPPPADEH